MKTQHATSEQALQMQVLGDFYRPPKAADRCLRVVGRKWFREEQELSEAQLAAVCWFAKLAEEGR